MQAIGKIYLDTNIFIFAFENTGRNSSILGNLFAVKGNGSRFVTSEPTLSELLVKPYRDGNEEAVAAYEDLMVGSHWLAVFTVEKPILRQAALLRADHRYLKLPDAIHVATAFAAGCTHMLTGDAGLRDDYDIAGDDRAPLKLLRPEETTLTSLIESLST